MIAEPVVPEQYEQVGVIEIPEVLDDIGNYLDWLEVRYFLNGQEKFQCGMLELED